MFSSFQRPNKNISKETLNFLKKMTFLLKLDLNKKIFTLLISMKIKDLLV